MGVLERRTRPGGGLHRARRSRRHFTLALSLRCSSGVLVSERRSVHRVTLAPSLEEHAMRSLWMACVLFVGVSLVSDAAAQATGIPSFNAPYRAFSRSEIGLVLTFPNGGGTAFEGAYRMSHGNFDLGFRGGIFPPGGGAHSRLLLRAEARERAGTH